MKVEIQVKLFVGGENYEVDLLMPQEAISANTPFEFGVYHVKNDEKNPEKPALYKKLPMLEVAVGGSGMFHVAVQPPSSVLELAKAQEVVKELQVVVSEGIYKDRKFLTQQTTQ